MSTTKLRLPELTANQSQKHLTHNEALFYLDTLVQLSVLDRDLATPPGSPALGDTYIVAGSPTGSWVGKTNQVASYDGSGWIFFVPAEGWTAWISDENVTAAWSGAAWVIVYSIGGGALADGDYGDVIVSSGGTVWTIDWSDNSDSTFRIQDNFNSTKVLAFELSGISASTTRTLTVPNASGTIAILDIDQTFTGNLTVLRMGLGGAVADITNRLAVETPSVLFDNAGNSIDIVVNKNGSGNDASISFKESLSTRAILGLVGDNNFTLQVSNDGTTFFDALTVIRTTGKVRAELAININPVAGNLAGAADGDIWYNSTTGKFRCREAGSAKDLLSGITDGDYGDIVVSGAGTVWQIDPSVAFGLGVALRQNLFNN